ncbi:hypothetical protein C8Q76DRAFT_747578 [Earliella scabrosa]|nr:hypothetical protein C8Q76DRAFT_747578 [Earliella scabrosa]
MCTNVNLVDLNDDVLRRICDYLSGKDALHFSLTAKRFHDLATTRVGVSLTAGYRRQFLSFLRSGTHPRAGLPPRVQHLERLVLKPGLYSMSASHRSDRDDLDRREDEFVTILGLLVELLSAAHNLRSLTLPGASAFLLRDRRLGAALSALPHLQHVTFGSVSDTAVKFVGETGWDLRTLDLNYNSPYGDSPMRAADEHMRTIPILHNALAQFRNLHTLKITHFKIGGWDLSHLAPTSPVPVFPSVRRLFIPNNLPLFALDLVDRCPNVEIVDLDSCHDGEDSDLRNLRNTPSPPLRSLRVDTLLPRPSGGHAERLLARSTADHLQITTQILLPMTLTREDDARSEVRHLLWFVERTSPLYAQISVIVSPAPMGFWDRVAESAPRLRYLELEVSLRDLDEECASWVDNVPEALRPLPLVYLRLHIAQLPDRRDISYRADDDSVGEPIWNVTEEAARAMYHARYVAVQALPERCARAIPTLRYFVLCDDGPTVKQRAWHEEERGGQAPVSGDDGDVDSVLLRMEKAEELDQLDPCCSYWRRASTDRWKSEAVAIPQTWRVWREEGDEGGRNDGFRLEKLTHGQGRELYRTLVSTFDGRKEALTESTLL